MTNTVTPGGTSNTLADVAMYYYQTDLRGGTDVNGATTGSSTNPSGTNVSANNIAVKSDAKDFVYAQHMVTFAIGLADGLMRYQPDYDTATNGDFYNIKNGVQNGCFWASGPCNWPAPVADGQSALDDLWHAAVNGRGQFYQALNANALDQGLQGALSSMGVKNAAAAASATSSPNVTQTSNSLFSTTFQTGTWAGRVFAQSIDPNSGAILDTHLWDAGPLLLLKVSASSDTRTIYTFDSSATTKLKPFLWANLTASEQSYFSGMCTAGSMAQCGGLTPAQFSDADNGANMVGFLRGQTGLEATVFRDRIDDNLTTGGTDQTVLGDTMDAKPIYVGAPTFAYADTGYSAFVSAQATRTPQVYVGANDGYLHVFGAATGVETWAYTPKFLMQGLYQLADTAYSSKHVFYVDGTPTIGDVYDTTAAAWKTIVVGGVNAGGNGFYALDITDPNNPKGLWEFCMDATLCPSTHDADLGFSFGNPIIGKRASDGKWVVVVTSGLNNTSGVGYFYVLDAITGAVLSKVATTNPGSTTVGVPATPSGLMKASAYFDSVQTDATFGYVYAGDQLGNVWRLDVTSATPAVTHMATLLDGSGRAQPITTRPELTQILTSRVLFIGTGRYLGVSDLTDPGAASGIAWQQSLYAFKDKNSDYGNLRNDNKMVVQTLSNTNGTLSVTSNAVDWTAKDGWYLDFNPPTNTAPGERVNVDPQLDLGTLTVATNVPVVSSTNSCTTGGGTSHKYDFDFQTGGAITGQPLATNLSSIIVGMAIVQLPSGVIKDIITTADTSKTSDTVAISAGTNAAQRFSYRER
jgi:type IV pilus assembly protein PilY1